MPVSTWLVMYEDNVSYNIIHNIIHVYKSTIHLTLYIRAHDTKRRKALLHVHVDQKTISIFQIRYPCTYSLSLSLCVCVCVYCIMAGIIDNIFYMYIIHVLYNYILAMIVCLFV